ISSATVNPGMAAAIRESGADVVHLHHPNPTGVLSYLASGSRAPLVVTYHSDIVRQRVLKTLFAPVQHHFLRRAHAIVASSPDYAASSPVLRRHAGRVRVIPFGIRPDEAGTPDAAAVAALRERHGPRVVLAVGRLVYYKGFDYLVRSMDSVDGHLVIVGDGPMREELERLAVEHGVAGRVTLAGRVESVASHYAAADVFALPATARSEAFGLVQLEAMAAGLPVVNTQIPSGVPFVSRDGQTGLTVPPRDPAALAAAITRLLDDAALRARLGRAARERVAAEFGAERMARDTLALYHEAAGRSVPAVPTFRPE
ncbi:MAG TPA: glycosyltransferase, partial [Longimicrobium sp.]|nr:glycosyltransferase [Longimicrobium sp.]